MSDKDLERAQNIVDSWVTKHKESIRLGTYWGDLSEAIVQLIKNVREETIEECSKKLEAVEQQLSMTTLALSSRDNPFIKLKGGGE